MVRFIIWPCVVVFESKINPPLVVQFHQALKSWIKNTETDDFPSQPAAHHDERLVLFPLLGLSVCPPPPPHRNIFPRSTFKPGRVYFSTTRFHTQDLARPESSPSARHHVTLAATFKLSPNHLAKLGHENSPRHAALPGRRQSGRGRTRQRSLGEPVAEWPRGHRPARHLVYPPCD